MARFQVLTVNDKKNFCECCGRQGLKKVVWILDTETQQEKHFGTSCAMQPVKGFGIDSEIKAAIRKHEDAQKAINMKAYYAYKASGGAYVRNGKAGWVPANRDLYNKTRANLMEA